MLIPEKTEHDLRTRFYVDPVSLAMTGTLILLLMVIHAKVLRPCAK